jgi:Ca2+-binding RTX toxin-like protein
MMFCTFQTSSNDDIRGGDSNDTLIGGVGDDSLAGYGGVDVLNGGAGNDTATIDLSTSTANNVVDIIASTTNYGATITSLEGLNAIGGSGNDTFVAGGLSDNLNGGGGDNTVRLSSFIIALGPPTPQFWGVLNSKSPNFGEFRGRVQGL